MKESRHAIENPANESPEPDDDLSFDLWDDDLAGRLGLLPRDPPDREILIAETIRGDQVTIRFPYEEGDWEPEEEVSHVLVRFLGRGGAPKKASRVLGSMAEHPCVHARQDG